MATIIISIIVFAGFSFAGFSVYKSHKSGKCTGGCSNCPSSCACSKNKAKI